MSEIHDKWQQEPEWPIAVQLHSALCKDSHQMDQCWGLGSPYDLKQPRLSDLQTRYLSMAQALVEVFGIDFAMYAATVLNSRDLPPLRDLD